MTKGPVTREEFTALRVVLDAIEQAIGNAREIQGYGVVSWNEKERIRKALAVLDRHTAAATEARHA